MKETIQKVTVGASVWLVGVMAWDHFQNDGEYFSGVVTAATTGIERLYDGVNTPDQSATAEPSESPTQVAPSTPDNFSIDILDDSTVTQPAEPSPTTNVGRDEQCVADMSIQDRIANLLVVPIDGNDYATKPGGPEETAEILKRYKIGGVIITTNGIKNPQKEVGTYTDKKAFPDIQEIMTDFEGGSGKQRIDRLQSAETAKVPTQRDVANSMTPEEATRLLRPAYQSLVDAGFTTVLGPVADVAPADGRPVEIGGYRVFGDDPKIVAEYLQAYVKAAESVGINPVFKHIPGGGHMAHTDYEPGEADPKSALLAHDLQVFKHLGAPVKAGVMINSAVISPEVAGDVTTRWSGGEPAVLSSAVISDIVKGNQIEGPIYSDDLGTPALKNEGSLAEIAARAIEAGVSRVLWLQNQDPKPLSLEPQIKAIIEESKKRIDSGSLSTDVMNKSVRRNYRSMGLDPCGSE